MNATLLDQIMKPLAACLTQDAEREIVAITADDATQYRVDALSRVAAHLALENMSCTSAVTKMESKFRA